MTTFGKTTVGGSFDNVAADFAQVSQYVLAAGITVATIKIYLDGNGVGVGSGSQPMKALIYTDSSDQPANLVTVSAEVMIAEAQAPNWVTFTLASPAPLSAATYWLGFIAGTPTNTARFTFDTVVAQRRFVADTYSDGPAAVWNAGGAGTDGEQISVYAETGGVQVLAMQTHISGHTYF